VTMRRTNVLMQAQANLQSDGEIVPCAICGQTETELVYVKSGYAIGRCVRCGLVYANPRAPQRAILARYSADYFWTEYLPSLGVVDGHYDLAAFDARYAVLLQMLSQRTPGRRLMEVGSGAGFFLKAAERAGWQVTGIELSTEGSRFAADRLGLEVLSDRVENLPFEPGSYDVAAMFEVIEHLFDPRAVLSALAGALAPGGTLVITTPNFDSASRFLLGVDWAVLSPLEHVYYFREESLRRLLEAAGFSQVEFVRRHVMWGPQETINFRYTHAPAGRRARICELIVRAGGHPLARLLQRAGRQDTLLCFARKAPSVQP
jgi:2-polyprenyl-3-methyl-5-hydroxy-6-metoxy-1,4-benzoquinol methylase